MGPVRLQVIFTNLQGELQPRAWGSWFLQLERDSYVGPLKEAPSRREKKSDALDTPFLKSQPCLSSMHMPNPQLRTREGGGDRESGTQQELRWGGQERRRAEEKGQAEGGRIRSGSSKEKEQKERRGGGLRG